VEAVRLERIDASRHEVSTFRCGDHSLDHWLHDEALSADHQAGSTVRVAINSDHVIGCYRLSAFHIEAQVVPRRRTEGPRPLPAILVSRLGVDVGFQNRGIGAALLWHALTVVESVALPLGVRVVVAPAAGERAIRLCSHFGFQPVKSDPERLYLLTQDISASTHAG
jgi:GNAT superfamily N-acetyltransferase